MDTSIVNTLITASTSTITWFLGLYLGKKDVGIPSTKKIREKQLSDLYVPIEQKLTFDRTQPPSAILEDIGKILAQNLELVPPEILSEFQRASLSASPDLRSLNKAVSSFYNWTRKYLGYPYDQSKITPEYTPVSKRTAYIQKIFSSIFVGIFGGSSGIFISQISCSPEQRTPIVVQISGIISLIGLLALMEYIRYIKEQ